MVTVDPQTRIIDLTVGELMELLGGEQHSIKRETPKEEKRFVYGIAGIAQLLNCSKATASRIKKNGIIDPAISQFGRKIMVDAELALELTKKHIKK